MAIHGTTSLGKIQDGIDNGTAFIAASVSGDDYRFHGVGQLPPTFAELYKAAQASGQLAYTVRSYVTPIAWKLANGEWVIPDVKYSVTTSGHQGIVRTAVANPGFYSRSRGRGTPELSAMVRQSVADASYIDEFLTVDREYAADGMFVDPYAEARAEGVQL